MTPAGLSNDIALVWIAGALLVAQGLLIGAVALFVRSLGSYTTMLTSTHRSNQLMHRDLLAAREEMRILNEIQIRRLTAITIPQPEEKRA